jgi:hypothetical protein
MVAYQSSSNQSFNNTLNEGGSPIQMFASTTAVKLHDIDNTGLELYATLPSNPYKPLFVSHKCHLSCPHWLISVVTKLPQRGL